MGIWIRIVQVIMSIQHPRDDGGHYSEVLRASWCMSCIVREELSGHKSEERGVRGTITTEPGVDDIRFHK